MSNFKWLVRKVDHKNNLIEMKTISAMPGEDISGMTSKDMAEKCGWSYDPTKETIKVRYKE